MIRVPKDLLDDLESAFLHLRFMANRVATGIHKGTDPQLLARALQKEVCRTLTTLTTWREARWRIEHPTGGNGAASATTSPDHHLPARPPFLTESDTDIDLG